MTLVLAIMHLYNIFNFFIAFVHSYFYTFLKSGIDKLTEWSMIPRGDTKGTNSFKKLCLMFVYVLFYVNLCQD